MKLSLNWLKEWVNPQMSSAKLAELLTLSGLEIEALTPAAKPFTKVYVGKVLSVEKHPQADRLKLCVVDAGKELGQLNIVCGAQNVRPNMLVPVAIEGAVLPDGLKIKHSKIRGSESQGMLCSAKELGLAEESEGLYEFSSDTPIGNDVWQYLNLNDEILEVSITPNRGDCLSVKGIAIDVSALTGSAINSVDCSKVSPKIDQKLNVTTQIAKECPHYVGRIIRNVKADVPTPIKIKERLRRSGIRSINAIVDIMNYVMLELGQPMHAFDLNKINREIIVRKAKASEELLLLDGTTHKLSPEMMIIADSEKPLAIAGIMGGLDSGVTLNTTDIFLESAYFDPVIISKTVRSTLLNSDSSYRFERGVDPELQMIAIERATHLLQECVGGDAGPITEFIEPKYLPAAKSITLRVARVEKILGIKFGTEEISSILKKLGFEIENNKQNLQVKIPARRFDINIEEDLIEEIARVYGYDKIPLEISKAQLQVVTFKEEQTELPTLRHVLKDQGYQEVITYTFIDKTLQKLFDPEASLKCLMNPISSDMEVMRTSLWPGLVNTLIYNQNRQQERVRIFEIGKRYRFENNKLQQEMMLSALVNGYRFPLQWGELKDKVDFYDLKGDLENIFKLSFADQEFNFKPGTHPALHPGQTALIYRDNKQIGIVGALHPAIVAQLKIDPPVYVYELHLESLLEGQVPKSKELSKFPEIRRDLAILIDQSIPYREIKDTIIGIAGELLKEVTIFDVYQGKGIAANKKSIAIALMLQDISRTLVDTEVINVMDKIILELKNRFAAELRG